MARFACATWKPISVNIGGTMSGSLGAILHHQAGNGGLQAFFNNPRNQVSAHFWISKTGVIEQMVDSGRVAWHGRAALNPRYVGVETEGCPGGRDEPLTEKQIDAFARLYREGHERHGWPSALANAAGQRGLGYHRMAVATGCPCQMRLNARPEILRRAFSGKAAPPPAAPAPMPAGVPAMHVTSFSRTFNPRHADVKTWQQKMRQRGWAIDADGIFGPASEKAARAFQREKGLLSDGVVGPVTWAATWSAPVT